MDYRRIFELVDRRLTKDLCPQLIDSPAEDYFYWILIEKHAHFIPNGQYGIVVIRILRQNPDKPLGALETAVLFHELGHHVWLMRYGKLSDRAHMQQNRWLVMREEYWAWRYGWQELKHFWKFAPKEILATALCMILLAPYCLYRYLYSLYVDKVDKFDF